MTTTLKDIKRREYGMGYNFTLNEEGELLSKGYKLVSAEDSWERDLLVDVYKASNYFTRVSFGTTRVNGIYSYFIWVKPKSNVNNELLWKLLAEAKTTTKKYL